MKKELAELLGVSASMVSRLAKRGMPVDSLERAERWRKRHLEPGRVKGMRYDRDEKTRPPAPARPAVAAKFGAGPGVATLEATRAVAAAVGLALTEGKDDQAATMLAPLRDLLRTLPGDALPRMPLCVWLALVEFSLHEDADVRNSPDVCDVLNPEEFAQRVKNDGVKMGPVWLDFACDWSGYSVNGWPERYLQA
ncbi:hypothetical protein BH10PSE16_BH10PSE16_41260 [soil metagenome]